MIDWTDDDINEYLWNRRARLSIIAVMGAELFGTVIEYRCYFAPIFNVSDMNNYIYLN